MQYSGSIWSMDYAVQWEHLEHGLCSTVGAFGVRIMQYSRSIWSTDYAVQ